MERNEHIQNELNDISTELAKVPFVTTLTIPQGYFEGLENQIFKQIHNEEVVSNTHSKEEIHQLSPLLSEIIHKNTYQVAPDYFEQNAKRLADIPKQIVAPVVQFPIRKRIIQLAIAASFIGLIGFFFYISLSQDQNHDIVRKGLEIQTEEAFNRYLDDVNEEEIIAYLDQHYLTTDHNEIGGFVDTESLPDEAAYFEEAILINN